VRQVDVAHQPENQGEAGGHQEIEPAEGDAVEQGVDENALLAEYVLEACRPGGEDKPEQKSDSDENDERGDGMAPDPAGGRTAASGRVHSFLIAKGRSHLLPSGFAGN